MPADGDRCSPPFSDPRNIAVGQARVIWALQTRTTKGGLCHEGWVLPGGLRTTDRDEAMATAVEMDRSARAAGG